VHSVWFCREFFSRLGRWDTSETHSEFKAIHAVSRALDLLSLALSAICADTAVRRGDSPDGWARQIALKVAMSDPEF